jgi:hypothetical protein
MSTPKHAFERDCIRMRARCIQMTRAIQTGNTGQKEAIRAAFLEENRPLSPDEALAFAQRRADALSIATVYRNIISSAVVAVRFMSWKDAAKEASSTEGFKYIDHDFFV